MQLQLTLEPELDVRDKKVKSFTVELITIQQATPIIKDWHYSGSTNGLMISHCFGLFSDSNLIGVAIYGGLAMANAWKKYATNRTDVIELRRLACIDNTPKNTESFFIAKTIKWLKRNTQHKLIVSYADTFHNHSGIIYQASNFQHVGMTSPGRIILDSDGRTFHDKSIRTTYTDKDNIKRLKPFASRLKKRLENGEANYVKTPGKHIYVYQLNTQKP